MHDEEGVEQYERIFPLVYFFLVGDLPAGVYNLFGQNLWQEGVFFSYVGVNNYLFLSDFRMGKVHRKFQETVGTLFTNTLE